jgi:amino acid transporter
MTKSDDEKQNSRVIYQGTLGTFSGVFTPSILTILGIILFLRLGYVVGSAGLARALIIIGLANAISILTSFSLSAIATNLKVKGGGDYYLISRTLGVEFGGAIGIVLFLAQSVSIAFYCIGFGEALTGILPQSTEVSPQIIAALAIAFLFIFVWLGTDWATRFQYVVMATLVAALISFFIGGFAKWDNAILIQNWTSSPSAPGFWVLFAIFFPAVTGFTQGVSMSGDLKDPGKSLPTGTFMAVGSSILIYFGAAVVFAAVLPNSVLTGDYGAMKQVAVISFLINVGVIAATLSSAMASFLGAPRILQSLAGDRIFPFLLPFAKGYGDAGNPRRGVLLSAGIAFATIALGKLNLIAPIVSMFFLISYGLLNYATHYEARTSSPSFRPTFRWFDARLSLLGWLACLGAMLAIDLTAGAVAIAVLFAIYQYLKRTAGPARWADSRRSYHLQQVRENLLAVASEPEHPRDWRPQILAFSNHPIKRERLLRFASWIEGGSGFTTVVHILEGEGVQMLKPRSEAEAELRKDIAEKGLKAFPLVLVAPSVYVGVQSLVQASGLGPIRANTVILNWMGQLHKGILGLGETKYARNLRTVFRFGCNIVILDAKDQAWDVPGSVPSGEKTIDVWWGDDSTSRLMLLLAHLMTRNKAWDEATIRVLAVEDEKGSEDTMSMLQKTLQEVRIAAKAEIVESATGDSIIAHSSQSDLVFLPFRLRADHLAGPFEMPLAELVFELPTVAFVLAAEDIDLEAEPEDGKAGELAAAMDALADAEKRAQKAKAAAAKAAEEAEEKIKELDPAVASIADEEFKSKVKATIKSKEEAEKASRRAAKALAKAEDAARKAEALGAIPDKERHGNTASSDAENTKDIK